MKNDFIKKMRRHTSTVLYSGSEEGIALLFVLWVLTILMVIVLSFSYATRTETYSTLSFKEGIENKFLAEAGIERGIMELFYRNMYRDQDVILEGREVWKVDGTPFTGQLGGGNYTVGIIDESGKIDINNLTDLSGIILKSLLMNSGVQEEAANTIVDSILDWRDPDDLYRTSGAESDYYMTLPNPYKAKNANFDTLEELLLVKGMTPAILYGSAEKKGIIDFITIYSNSPMISANAAPKEVLTAIPGITPEIADVIISSRGEKKITNLQEFGVPVESFRYLGVHESGIFTIESVGHKGSEKKGYAIKATVSISVGANEYKYRYYKTPTSIRQ